MATVSVLLPTRDDGGRLAEGAGDVLALTVADLGLIVVDDGATDGSVKALREG